MSKQQKTTAKILRRWFFPQEEQWNNFLLTSLIQYVFCTKSFNAGFYTVSLISYYITCSQKPIITRNNPPLSRVSQKLFVHGKIQLKIVFFPENVLRMIFISRKSLAQFPWQKNTFLLVLRIFLTSSRFLCLSRGISSSLASCRQDSEARERLCEAQMVPSHF